MTYFIAVPLLYKEVVIGSLASFLLGVDDYVKPHHTGCSQIPSTTQTRICGNVRRNGNAHDCSRHPSSIVNDADKHQSPSVILHKQQLLQLVEAIHIVYTPRDKDVFSNARPQDFAFRDDFLKHLDEVADIQRYKDVPSFINSLPAHRLLPKLQRLTVGSWCRWEWKEANNLDEADHIDVSEAYKAFDERLAKDMYQIAPPIVCRYHCDDGLLRHYPVKHGDTVINILHDAQLDSFGSCLVVGARNIVHVESPCRPSNPSPYEEFFEFACVTAESLVDTMFKWVHDLYINPMTYHATKVKFVIHRPDDWDYNTETDADILQSVRMMHEVIQELRNWIDDTPGSNRLDYWDSWSVVWIEDYPACPACEPEEFEFVADEIATSSSSSASSD